MAHPVITFPQPPPTSNTLTSHQRQHLLRSTRKLTKLLGSAPHLIDCDKPFPAVYLNLSSNPEPVSRSPSLSRCSCEIPRPPSPTSTISSVSTTASKHHHKHRSSSVYETHTPQDALDPPFSKHRPPILRLASTDDECSECEWSKTVLGAVPGFFSAAPDTASSQASDASDDGSTDRLLSPTSSPTTQTPPSISRSYTLPVPRRKSISSPFAETSEPTFRVTSEAATRRLKMERIRKRLGECVPVDAVFPHESLDDGDEDEDFVSVTPEKKPAQVNIDLRPRWKSASAVVAFDVIYECPDEHGDEGLANGLSFGPSTPKNSTCTFPRTSYPTPPRHPAKLLKKSRREVYF